MTKQRFESIHNDIGLRDNTTGNEYLYYSVDVIELLNGLNEENEQLKKENKKLLQKIFEIRTENALNRTEISKQHYTVDEFEEMLDKW